MCSRSLACSEPSSLGPSSIPCSVAVRRDLGRILRVIPGKGSCRVFLQGGQRGALCSHLCSLSSFCAGSASPSPFPARILAVLGGGRGLVQGGLRAAPLGSFVAHRVLVLGPLPCVLPCWVGAGSLGVVTRICGCWGRAPQIHSQRWDLPPIASKR